MKILRKITLCALLALTPTTALFAGQSAKDLVEQFRKETNNLPAFPPSVRPVKPVTPPKAAKEAPKGKKEVSDKVTAGIQRLYKKYNPKLSDEAALAMARSTVAHCTAQKVNPTLMAGIIIVESRANPKARNKSMLGLCQVHWGVHKKTVLKKFPQIKGLNDMFIADNNIAVGSWILSGYLQACGGNETKALYRYLGRSNTKYVKRVKGYQKEALGK